MPPTRVLPPTAGSGRERSSRKRTWQKQFPVAGQVGRSRRLQPGPHRRESVAKGLANRGPLGRSWAAVVRVRSIPALPVEWAGGAQTLVRMHRWSRARSHRPGSAGDRGGREPARPRSGHRRQAHSVQRGRALQRLQAASAPRFPDGEPARRGGVSRRLHVGPRGLSEADGSIFLFYVYVKVNTDGGVVSGVCSEAPLWMRGRDARWRGLLVQRRGPAPSPDPLPTGPGRPLIL